MRPDLTNYIARQGVLDSAYKDILHIDWTINSVCNYRCSYCFSQSKPLHEDYDVKRVLKTVDNLLFLKRPFYCFRLIGGEPTLFPHFSALLRRIFSQTDKAGILTITNGSRASEWFEKNLAIVPKGLADIHISLHLEFAKKEHILEILNIIASMGHNASIRFMFNPELKEKARDFAEFLTLKRANIPFSMMLRALREPPDFINLDSRYNDEDIQWMNEVDENFTHAAHNSRFQTPNLPPYGSVKHWFVNTSSEGKPYPHNYAYRNGLMNFKGYWCNPEHTTICINPFFQWRGATCNAFPWMPFTIDSNEFKNHLPGKPIQCPFDNCGCDAVYFAPKFQEKAEALKWRRKLLVKKYLGLPMSYKNKIKCFIR